MAKSSFALACVLAIALTLNHTDAAPVYSVSVQQPPVNSLNLPNNPFQVGGSSNGMSIPYQLLELLGGNGDGGDDDDEEGDDDDEYDNKKGKYNDEDDDESDDEESDDEDEESDDEESDDEDEDEEDDDDENDGYRRNANGGNYHKASNSGYQAANPAYAFKPAY